MIAVVLISISTRTLLTFPFVYLFFFFFFGPSVVAVVVVVASLLRVVAWDGKLKIPRQKPVNTRVHSTGLDWNNFGSCEQSFNNPN